MGKKKRTLLMAMLSLFLAALIVVAGVLGYVLARSAYSDTSETYAAEARWAVTEKTLGEIEEKVTVPIEKIRPDYQSYEAHINDENKSTWSLLPDDDPGVPKTYADAEDDDGSSVTYTVRNREFFGVVATLQNSGDVAAAVTVTDTGIFRFDMDGCGCDDDRYTDDEVAAHISCELYWSTDGTYETVEQAKSGQESGPLTLSAEGEDAVYFYARVVWTTDLEKDMFELDDSGNVKTDSNGNKTLNTAYDGTQGDEFDTWAGEHLTGITFSVTMRAEQAE